MEKDTLGSKLLALKERSGLSLASIAKAAGYKNASSIQRYFSKDYDAEYLPKRLADRIQRALVGFGDPVIYETDISRLRDYGFEYDRVLPPPPEDMRFKRTAQDHIDVFTSRVSGTVDGEISISSIIFEEAIIKLSRPEHLKRRSIFGAYVSASHMMPRHMPGEIIFYETDRPASIGRDVVVVIAQPEGSDIEPYDDTVVGKLSAIDADSLEVELLNPNKPLRFLTSEVEAVWPLLDAVDLLAPAPNV